MSLELNAVTTGEGPAVLLLHGLFGSATNWRGIARALSDDFQVHALDLRNHGSSPWADSMAYDEMAGDVLGFIDRQALANVSVIGHSMGGKAAMALALLNPDRIDQLIVADVAPVSYADTLTPFAEAMRSVDVFAAASRTEVQRRLQSMLPDPSVAGFLAQNLINRNDHFDWRINLAAITAEMSTLSGFPEKLRTLHFDRPITVIAGADSAYVAHKDGAEFAPMFSQVSVEVIQGAGHWVHADRPDDFVAIARRALGS